MKKFFSVVLFIAFVFSSCTIKPFSIEDMAENVEFRVPIDDGFGKTDLVTVKNSPELIHSFGKVFGTPCEYQRCLQTICDSFRVDCNNPELLVITKIPFMHVVDTIISNRVYLCCCYVKGTYMRDGVSLHSGVSDVVTFTVDRLDGHHNNRYFILHRNAESGKEN